MCLVSEGTTSTPAWVTGPFDLLLGFQAIPCLSNSTPPSQSGSRWTQSPGPRISGCSFPRVLAQHYQIFPTRKFFLMVGKTFLFAPLWRLTVSGLHIPLAVWLFFYSMAISGAISYLHNHADLFLSHTSSFVLVN